MMKDSTFWKRQYGKFIDDILRKEQQMYRYNIYGVRDQIEYLQETKDENLAEDPKKEVLYQNVNHCLNLLDPIGCCYPMIVNEYSGYTWKILHMYRSSKNGTDFKNRLERFLCDLWDSIGSFSASDNIRQIKGAVDDIERVGLSERYCFFSPC